MPFLVPIANGKIADALASTLACTTVAVWLTILSTQYVRATESLQLPDRPHARLSPVCSLFAGWRCLCPVRHSHHYFFLHLREHRKGARSCSKLPVALLGYSHVLRYVLAGRWWCRHPIVSGRHRLNRQLPSVFQPSYREYPRTLRTCQPRL